MHTYCTVHEQYAKLKMNGYPCLNYPEEFLSRPLAIGEVSVHTASIGIASAARE